MHSQTPNNRTLDLQPLLTAKLPELHTLSLCQTYIPSLDLPTGWTSLHNLNLASCGLHTLPDAFGLCVPNLRCLNLNFNAIKDLRPLLNMGELNTLLAASNRLSRLRKTAAVLSRLSSLENLDLRDNPFTVGFYAKPHEHRLVTAASSPAPSGDEKNEHSMDAEEEHFTLPPCTRELDATYFSRLDEGTKLRRRVYEMLLTSSCKVLDSLDGKRFVKGDVLVRDGIWERLVVLGVVKKSGTGRDEPVLMVEDA